MKAYRFQGQAEAEFRSAIDWYDAERPGLGDEFSAAVNKAVVQLCNSPTAYSLVIARAGVRRCPVRRFPYNIIYVELNEVVWILAVAHHRRRPGYWVKRLPE